MVKRHSRLVAFGEGRTHPRVKRQSRRQTTGRGLSSILGKVAKTATKYGPQALKLAKEGAKLYGMTGLKGSEHAKSAHSILESLGFGRTRAVHPSRKHGTGEARRHTRRRSAMGEAKRHTHRRSAMGEARKKTHKAPKTERGKAMSKLMKNGWSMGEASRELANLKDEMSYTKACNYLMKHL